MRNQRKGLWYASIAGTFAAAFALGIALPDPSFAQGSSGSSGGSAASDSSGQSDGASGSSPSGSGSAAQDSSGQSEGTPSGSGRASGENQSTTPGSGTAQGESGQSGSMGSTGSAGTAGSSTGTQSAMTADELQGKNVMTSTGEELGEVEDVVIEQGQVKAALVDVGGFLGLGAKRVAIPQERLSVQGENVQTTMTQDEIAALPEYEEGQGSSGSSMGTGSGSTTGTGSGSSQ
jgi:sporulation protein YlmC with PRC-barrel domain